MKKPSTDLLVRIFVPVYLAVAFLYLFVVIKPSLYFHHDQAPFLLSSDFLASYLVYPGGPIELLANLVMQSFYFEIIGTFVFFFLSLSVFFLVKGILDRIHLHQLNRVCALLPFTFSIAIVNNYNLPYSIILSFILLLLVTWFISRMSEVRGIQVLMISIGSLLIYYISGTGYLLLFTILVVLIHFHGQKWKAVPGIGIAVFLAVLTPLLAQQFLFQDISHGPYPKFFAEEISFKEYTPSLIYYILLVSLPILLLGSMIISGMSTIRHRLQSAGSAIIILVVSLVMVFTIFSHYSTYISDAKKIVASDYYCYHLDAEKVARAATSIENYSFSANINYNLAMAKAGRLNEEFFKFFQVSGINALCPDVEFSAELAFLSADFYYDLGYISEARHWAYEALVFNPHSYRAHRLLVKIHLVTGEYDAAERSLHILGKGVINRRFVKQYVPLAKDTSLIADDAELTEKRDFMPGSHELDPLIVNRFAELISVNTKNKRAYEYFMLYCLLDGNFDAFLSAYQDAGEYFDEPQTIYDEAILMFGFLNNTEVLNENNISEATVKRFTNYQDILNQHARDRKMARNVLYWKMGTTCMYYLQFVEPYIIVPVINDTEHDEPQI
jgi:hypothetical protein